MITLGELFGSRVESLQPVQSAAACPDATKAASALLPLRVNRTATIYAVVAVSIIIALSPALFFSFGYHNDFNAWAYDTHSCCTHQPETRILLGTGRYFAAFAENIQFFTIHTLRDLWLWRLVAVLSTALLAVYYLRIVSLRCPPTWLNACLSVALFSLPTMQLQAIWVSMYTMWTPPILLSLIAAHLLITAADGDILADHVARRRAGKLALLAFAVLLTGFFFYPLSATFVLVPAAHLLLSERIQQARRMAVLAVAALGGAFVALFIIHKFVVLPHLSGIYLGDYEFDLAGNLPTEAVLRLRAYLLDGAFLWLGLEIRPFRTLIELAAVTAAIYCAIRILRRSIKTNEMLNVLATCSLLVFAAAPLLVIQQFTLSYRVMFAMDGIELLVLFWLVRQLPVGSVRLATLFAGLGIAFSLVDVYGTSASAYAEYALYSQSVAGLSPHEFHSITILRPSRPRQAFGLALRNEFGGAAPIAHAFDLVIGARYNGEATFDITELPLPSDFPSSIEETDNTLPLAIERDSLVIDTSPIYGVPSFKDISSRLAVVSARPRGSFGPANAVDGDTYNRTWGTFWEVCGWPFPMHLELDFPTAHTLRGYSLSTVEETERMPSSWEIWITLDGLNWRRLQDVTDPKPWKVHEVRRYDVEPAPGVTGIRLVITATHVESCMRLYEFRPIF